MLFAMTFLDGLMVFLIILIVYSLLLFILKKTGFLDKYNISLYGPALLLRTKKGKNFLKKLALKKRFWRGYGSFSVFFCFIMMVLFTMLIIWNTWMAFGLLGLPPEEKANLPGPEVALVLPGINPILPLEYIGYIVLALIIAIVVHEFSHGVLTFVGKIKVKSLGILYLIIPVGAFVEPDEEQLKKTSIGKRMRVYAAGPMSNFVVAFIFLLVFSFVFMSAVEPVDGAQLLYIIDDTPAEEIGLTPGMVITSFNDTEIHSVYEFYNVVRNTTADQKVNISYYKRGKIINTNVTLVNRYNYTKNQSHMNQGFLGVGFNPYTGYIYYLKNPFKKNIFDSILLVYSVPIFGYIAGFNPIAAPFTDGYKLVGPLSVLPVDVFWAIVNALYWVFWLNLALGAFNVLPMTPLDGGFLFSDGIRSIVKRRKHLTEEKREKIVRNVSLIVSLIILFVIIFPFFVKYL